ncbi:Uncharacterised protein [Streptococcus pneumoniae]|nr:Uncharacterised protein [Streptococcus pneumoniae]VKX22383.1 Uncharacterised protein [Streptococcus pneumoniae]
MNIKALIKKYEAVECVVGIVSGKTILKTVLRDLEQPLEEGMKNQSKRIKIPMEIRPFDVGYRIVNKHGQALALKNGASIFALPSLAEKAIKKEFSKNDPDFDIEKHFVEEVAIVNLSKFHSYFEDRV